MNQVPYNNYKNNNSNSQQVPNYQNNNKNPSKKALNPNQPNYKSKTMTT